MPRAAIYARLSKVDIGPDGALVQQANLDQQVARGREEAERRGFVVANVYIEPGRSGFKEHGRPQLARLTADIKAGRVDVVIVRHLDRLYRNTARALLFRDRVRVIGYEQGIDTAERGSRLSYAVNAALAEEESTIKSERGKAHRERMREAGRPRSGGPRAYGFEADGVTPRRSEQKLIRESAAAIARGDSLRSVVKRWNERGVRNSRGRAVAPVTVRRVLLRAEQYGTDPDIAERVRRILADPRRTSNGTGANRKHFLLNGMLYCECGGRMYGVRVGRARELYYRCHTPTGGCGRLYIKAAPIDSLAVLGALDRKPPPPPVDGADSAALAERLIALEARAENKRVDYARDRIDAETLRVALADIEAETVQVRRGLATSARIGAAVAALTDAAEQRLIERLNVVTRNGVVAPGDFDRRRALVEASVERITVRAVGRNDVPVADRTEIVWRA